MTKERRRSWDDFFFGMNDEFDEMRRRMDMMLERMMGGEAPSDTPLSYGFSMVVGPDGEPRVQEFGNAALTDPPETHWEPLIDMIEEENRVRVILELPGVEKDEVQLNLAERALDIEIDSPHRRLSKHLELPRSVDPDSAKASYNNGVLEICLTPLTGWSGSRKIGIE